ncbi:hypothetical protein [Streptococcus marimammalium]|uniref:hypothetical protein n=1 Tax=Streptococcus marimammalium TaxID=269666 RepID=UPI00037FCEC7|nr:hypothetical protein [Streptococcus marimammalium]
MKHLKNKYIIFSATGLIVVALILGYLWMKASRENDMVKSDAMKSAKVLSDLADNKDDNAEDSTDVDIEKGIPKEIQGTWFVELNNSTPMYLEYDEDGKVTEYSYVDGVREAKEFQLTGVAKVTDHAYRFVIEDNANNFHLFAKPGLGGAYLKKTDRANKTKRIDIGVYLDNGNIYPQIWVVKDGLSAEKIYKNGGNIKGVKYYGDIPYYEDRTSTDDVNIGNTIKQKNLTTDEVNTWAINIYLSQYNDRDVSYNDVHAESEMLSDGLVYITITDMYHRVNSPDGIHTNPRWTKYRVNADGFLEMEVHWGAGDWSVVSTNYLE